MHREKKIKLQIYQENQNGNCVIVGAGMMGSALAFPARENGNEVRIVGTPLDRDIIDVCIKTGKHPKFSKAFPSGIEFYQVDALLDAISGADMIIGGVSSFGVEWFGDNVLPIIPEDVPVLTVTKGLFDTPDGRLLTYPELWQGKLDSMGKRMSLNAIGGPLAIQKKGSVLQTIVISRQAMVK